MLVSGMIVIATLFVFSVVFIGAGIVASRIDKERHK